MSFNVGNLFGGAFGTEQVYFFDNPYLLALRETDYIRYEIESLYKKLLFDCLSRSEGILKAKTKSTSQAAQEIDLSPYYDSVIVGDAGSKGMVSLLANAMAEKKKISIVYADQIIRLATPDEEKLIDSGKPSKGVACDFSNYLKSDILTVYFSLLYQAIISLNSHLKITKSLQVKISKLRELVGLKDARIANDQAKKLSAGLKDGKSVLIDELDSIESMKLDTEPASKAIELITSRVAGVIGMPVSYLNGQVATGLSAAGQGDELVIERGLQNIFNEVFKRVSDKVLGTNLKFKKNVWGMIAERLKLLPIVESSALYDDAAKKEFADKAINP